MKLTIDELTSFTGWTPSDITKIDLFDINEHNDFIAGDNSGSLIFHFSANSSGAYVEKIFSAPFDVTNYDQIVINVYNTKNKNQGGYYNNRSNFLFQIDFNNTMTDYMIPVYNSLVPIALDISDITSISRIRVTSNTNLEDYLVVSHCVAVSDELPYDIFRDLKTSLENEITAISLNRKYKVGVATVSTGQATIKINASGSYARDWIEKYSVIEIVSGATSEIHQLMDNNEETYNLGEMYDGNEIVNIMTTADVYLYFPVEFGLDQTEILLPGISISGMAPKIIKRGSKEESRLDSYKYDMTVNENYGYNICQYEIIINCEARVSDLIADMQDVIKRVLSREKLWVNGRKYQIDFLNDPVHVPTIDSYNQIPKAQYSMSIEIKEYRYPVVTLPNSETITTTYTIQ